MMPSKKKPVLRPEVDHLFAVEEIARKVRRSIIADPEKPPPPLDAPAPQLLDNAISYLVAARTILEGK